MTCIVGLVDNGKVYIGGDSAGVSGYSITARNDDKVFRNGDFVMGFTSSFRMGQLLRYHFNPPPCNTWDIERYMVTDFIDGVRSCLKDGGFARISNNEEHGGVFLVGFKDRLFQIDSDYQVGWNTNNFDAVGCGDHLALGAMHILKDLKLTATEKILAALSAAETYSAGVRSPFKVVSL